jgi:hypothetical protein
MPSTSLLRETHDAIRKADPLVAVVIVRDCEPLAFGQAVNVMGRGKTGCWAPTPYLNL